MRKKALLAQYEIRTGRNNKLVDFGKPFDDIIVVDMFNQQTLAWNVKEAKEKMGLKPQESNAKVIPYLINELLITMQETDWKKVKKAEKKAKKKK